MMKLNTGTSDSNLRMIIKLAPVSCIRLRSRGTC